jgi:hypothetical protein
MTATTQTLKTLTLTDLENRTFPVCIVTGRVASMCPNASFVLTLDDNGDIDDSVDIDCSACDDCPMYSGEARHFDCPIAAVMQAKIEQNRRREALARAYDFAFEIVTMEGETLGCDRAYSVSDLAPRTDVNMTINERINR